MVTFACVRRLVNLVGAPPEREISPYRLLPSKYGRAVACLANDSETGQMFQKYAREGIILKEHTFAKTEREMYSCTYLLQNFAEN